MGDILYASASKLSVLCARSRCWCCRRRCSCRRPLWRQTMMARVCVCAACACVCAHGGVQRLRYTNRSYAIWDKLSIFIHDFAIRRAKKNLQKLSKCRFLEIDAGVRIIHFGSRDMHPCAVNCFCCCTQCLRLSWFVRAPMEKTTRSHVEKRSKQ